jgi:hypothetical protein
MVDETAKFEVSIYIADAHEDEDDFRYTVEHGFTDRPGIETIKALFEEAKHEFAILYPGVEAESFSIYVHRLPPPGQRDLSSASRREQ